MPDLIDPTRATSPAFNRRTFVGLSAGAASFGGTAAAALAAPAPAYGQPHAPIVAENDPDILAQPLKISYQVHGTTRVVDSYTAQPKNAKPSTPGVVVVQAIWGVDAQLRDVVRRLAKAGYVAIAPDLYSGLGAPSGDGATDYTVFSPVAAKLNDETVDRDLQQCALWIRRQGQASTKAGMVGFCMGGSIALRQSVDSISDFKAISVFYGSVRYSADGSNKGSIVPIDLAYASSIGVPVVGSWGARDTSILPDDVRALEQRLDGSQQAARLRALRRSGACVLRRHAQLVRCERRERCVAAHDLLVPAFSDVAVAFTLVHCADVHLDTTFPDTRGGSARRAALADAFVRIVDEALERGADALTIGGDLYEAERAGPATVRFLFEQFARFGKPIFVAPGNHDPHAPGSLLARSDLPENVLVFNEAAWRAIPLAEGITLYGFGHTPAEPGRPFAGARFERGGVQIALVHGSDEARCPPNKRATAPFSQREVSASGASLLLDRPLSRRLLGDRARRCGDRLSRLARADQVRRRRGSRRGCRARRERHRRSVARSDRAHATLRDRLRLERRRTRARRARRASRRLSASLGRRDYVRLHLTGQVAHGTRLDVRSIQDRFEEGLGSLEIGDRTSSFDYDSIAREPTVRGHVVRDLLALARDDDSELAGEALRYALAAFDGAEIAP